MAADTPSHRIARRAAWNMLTGLLEAVVGVALIVYPLANATDRWAIGALVGIAVLVDGIARTAISTSILRGVHRFRNRPERMRTPGEANVVLFEARAEAQASRDRAKLRIRSDRSES